jgi:cell division protein FtsL
MTRLNLLLLVALLASSVYLVRVSYDARHLFGELDRAQSQQRQLETEYGRLDAERQTQATSARVEKTARDRLRMAPASPAITRPVTLAASAARAEPAAVDADSLSRGQP